MFTINLAEQRYVCEWGRDGVMFMCAHLHDVAFCVNTVRNLALGLWLAGHPPTPGLCRWVAIFSTQSWRYRTTVVIKRHQDTTSKKAIFRSVYWQLVYGLYACCVCRQTVTFTTFFSRLNPHLCGETRFDYKVVQSSNKTPISCIVVLYFQRSTLNFISLKFCSWIKSFV